MSLLPKLKFTKTPIVILIIMTMSVIVLAGGVEWKPVSAEELAMKTPKVEPDADAEAIFWEIRLDDSSDNELAYKHYVRVKIFTERGRERFSKFDIFFAKGKRVKNIAARVIKPDGTIVELKESDIFEREIIKANGLKVKAKSFAVPGIEPGVIVEYQYRELIEGDSASGERLVFQRDIPMERVSYYVKPYTDTTLGYRPYNIDDIKFVKDKGGYFVATLTDVPAFKEEPKMPPEDEVKYWMFIYYTSINTTNQAVSSMLRWAFFSSSILSSWKDLIKPNKEVKAKAAELAGGVTSPDDKLRKFYEFTQGQIKNTNYDNTITDEQRKKIKNNNAGDTLKRGIGTPDDIDILFASLATASGFEARIVFSGDRSELFFQPERDAHRSFVHAACVAVKIDDTWHYFNPGTQYLPYETLVWFEEGVSAILIGNDGYIWKRTPLTDYSKSLAKRTGKFKLLEDGALEGDANVEFTGQQAITRRRNGIDDSQTKREDDFKNEIKQSISAAEISDLRIDNFTDTSKPLIYSFKIKVPNYAQKTGKRLFLQPGFFEYGKDTVFTSSTRKYDIYFTYPWSENDSIEFTLPKGFVLDNADAPAGLADPQKIGSIDVRLGVSKDQGLLVYNRKFHFGGGGNVLFPASTYPQLKNMFDAFHKVDSHTITLKQQ